MKNERRKEWKLFGINLALVIMIIIPWFSSLNLHVFMGDDLYWIQAYHSGKYASTSWSDAVAMGLDNTKFRPVTNIFLAIETKTFQDCFDCYIAVNLCIFILNVLLVALCAYEITAKWWPSIYISSVIFVLSRFSYYSVLQVMGTMENLAMTFMLLLIICVIRYLREPKVKWMVLGIVALSLVILTHERFIVLVVPVIFSLFAKKNHLKLSEFILFLLTLLFLPIIYGFIKQDIFNSPLFLGTANTNVSSTFQFSQFMGFICKGILNLIGFNAGPDYLSGKNFLNAGPMGIILGLILSVTLTILVYIYIKISFKKKNWEFELFMVLVLMIGALISASSITIRQEYRWLYTPFTVFVLLVCYMLSRIPNVKLKYLLIILITISFTSVDIFYRQFIFNVFFMDGLRTASSIKLEIIDKNSLSELSQKDIYIITGGNKDIQAWYMLNDEFFKLYTHNPGIKVHYLDDINAIPLNSFQNNRPLVFQVKQAHVTMISQDAILKSIIPSNFNTDYDFVKNYSSGIVNDNIYVSTPTGRGAFIVGWPDNYGIINNTLTIISPFSINYPSIVCQRGSTLIFQASIPFSMGDGASLYILTKSHGMNQSIAEIPLLPTKENGVLTWNDYNIPLADCSGQKIDITFGVDSPSGNTTADWIALAGIKLVVKK